MTDLQIWGEPEPKVPTICPLKENGKCPPGCCECARFAHEMVYGSSELKVQSSEIIEHSILNLELRTLSAEF